MDNIYSMYHISSSKTMPKSFLYNCFKRCKKGDMKAREIIIIDNIKLVLAIIEEEFTNENFELEELLLVGIIGLIKSVDSFEMGKKYDFKGYATKYIRNEIYRYMKQERRSFYKSSLDQLLETKEILDSKQDVVSRYEKQEEVLIVRRMLHETIDNDIEKQIVFLYFGFGDKILTEVQIAKELGLSLDYVKQVIKNFIVKMTIKIKEEYKVKKLNK